MNMCSHNSPLDTVWTPLSSSFCPLFELFPFSELICRRVEGGHSCGLHFPGEVEKKIYMPPSLTHNTGRESYPAWLDILGKVRKCLFKGNMVKITQDKVQSVRRDRLKLQYKIRHSLKGTEDTLAFG